ncbi:MAG: FmdB family zinc ribbon protein [Porticoccaceae bacterium]
MPIYAYQCQACGQEIEAIQKISDAPLTECASCKGALKKMLTAPAFRLSGSGWYETDFKKDNRKNLAGDQPSASSSDSSGGCGSGACAAAD